MGMEIKFFFIREEEIGKEKEYKIRYSKFTG